MSLTLAHKTNRPSEAIVIFSLLEAGGFHPSFQNYYHGYIAIGYLSALDGIQIMLPSQEIQAAQDYVNSVKPIEDFDQIPNHWVRDLIQASILTSNPFFFVFLLSPLVQTVCLAGLIVLNILVFSETLLLAILGNMTFAFFILMLAHAKYVAVPKLRESP